MKSTDPRVLLTIFLLVQVLVVGALETVVRTLVAPNDYIFRRAELFQKRRTLDGAFGDSHTMRDLTDLPNMTNFGLGSDTIFDISAKIFHYYADQRGFRIIVQASPQQMLQRSTEPSDRTRIYLTDSSPIPLLAFRPYFREQLPRILLSLIMNPKFHNSTLLTADGAELADTSMTSLTPEERKRLAFREMLSKEPPVDFASSPQAREFVKLAQFLTGRGAEVCLLTTPVSRDYSGGAREHPTFRAVRAWYDQLAMAHGFKRIDLFDSDLPDRFFTNSDHLNATGAHLLGPRIYSACFGAANQAVGLTHGLAVQ